jgi:hypothetical protein
MKQLVAILLFIVIGSAARADIFIEPWLGYEMGTYKYPAGSLSGDISGTNYGARLGYKMLGLSFGAEYSGVSLTEKPTSGSNLSVSGSDLGLFVGFNFPVLLRVYATYILSSTGKVDTYTSGNFTGSGSRIGVGFTGLPFVVINLEAISRDYNKYAGNSISGGDLKYTSFGLNVSLPLP